MPTIISVEGNIGSGKSTLVSEMKEALPTLFNGQIYFLQEPVDEWEKICDTNGESIITKFYNNQKKYAFSFQMMAYISRLKTLTELVNKIPQDSIIICERSVWTDKNIFAKMLYQDNNIEDINYVIYNKWFEFFMKETNLGGIIYLNTDPETSFKRVIKRSRDGENIPIEYLKKCHNYHSEWFKYIDKPLLTLNDIDKEGKVLTNDWIKSITNFIKNIQLNKKREIFNTDKIASNIDEILSKSHC